MNWAPRRGQPEHKLHVAVARFLNVALPLDSFWTTIPTAGSSLTQGAKIKARGYKAGTPDLVIIYRGKAHWLELKSAAGTVAIVQRDCHGMLHRAGSPVGLARDLNDVEFWLKAWGLPLRAIVDPRQISGARSIA